MKSQAIIDILQVQLNPGAKVTRKFKTEDEAKDYFELLKASLNNHHSQNNKNHDTKSNRRQITLV